MEDWTRDYFESGGGNPFLFYVLFGNFTELGPLSRSKYWSSGVPKGVELMHYSRESHGDVIDSFCEGYLWDSLKNKDNALAAKVPASGECYALKGEISDPDDLNYFRDAIGILTYFADHGGLCLYDPFMFKWWGMDEWRRRVFEPHELSPRDHSVILFSEEADGVWYHTRGLRKFGRPDLSIHGMDSDSEEGALEVINRFIEFQALGGVIEEGAEVRVKGFPEGYRCRHRGDLDDPDFNNVHIEIVGD